MKNKYILLLTIIISSLYFNTVMATGKTEYFRHLKFRETPFSPYQGIYPIDKQLAKSTAHYRFEYDDQNRITSIAHMIGNRIINDNGNWDTFIWFAPKVQISYLSGQEVHHYFDTNNQRITAHGDVYSATYKLDELGRRQSLKFTNADNEASENTWGIHQYQWQHINNRQMIEKRFNLKQELMPIRPVLHFYETHMTFDHLGQLQLMKNYGLNGEPSNNESGAGIDRIFYDLDGNFQRWHVLDKNGTPVAGNRPMVHIGEHLYDQHGNKIGMRGFDTQGLPIKFSWGDFLIRKHYDEFGNQIEGSVYDEENRLVSKMKVEYSDDGLRRTWLKNLNQDEKLESSERLGGAAAIKYEYQGKGLDVLKTIPHDTKLQPIKQD
jgi:hypothetical protein